MPTSTHSLFAVIAALCIALLLGLPRQVAPLGLNLVFDNENTTSGTVTLNNSISSVSFFNISGTSVSTVSIVLSSLAWDPYVTDRELSILISSGSVRSWTISAASDATLVGFGGSSGCDVLPGSGAAAVRKVKVVVRGLDSVASLVTLSRLQLCGGSVVLTSSTDVTLDVSSAAFDNRSALVVNSSSQISVLLSTPMRWERQSLLNISGIVPLTIVVRNGLPSSSPTNQTSMFVLSGSQFLVSRSGLSASASWGTPGFSFAAQMSPPASTPPTLVVAGTSTVVRLDFLTCASSAAPCGVTWLLYSLSVADGALLELTKCVLNASGAFLAGVSNLVVNGSWSLCVVNSVNVTRSGLVAMRQNTISGDFVAMMVDLSPNVLLSTNASLVISHNDVVATVPTTTAPRLSNVLASLLLGGTALFTGESSLICSWNRFRTVMSVNGTAHYAAIFRANISAASSPLLHLDANSQLAFSGNELVLGSTVSPASWVSLVAAIQVTLSASSVRVSSGSTVLVMDNLVSLLDTTTRANGTLINLTVAASYAVGGNVAVVDPSSGLIFANNSLVSRAVLSTLCTSLMTASITGGSVAVSSGAQINVSANNLSSSRLMGASSATSVTYYGLRFVLSLAVLTTSSAVLLCKNAVNLSCSARFCIHLALAPSEVTGAFPQLLMESNAQFIVERNALLTLSGGVDSLYSVSSSIAVDAFSAGIALFVTATTTPAAPYSWSVNGGLVSVSNNAISLRSSLTNPSASPRVTSSLTLLCGATLLGPRSATSATLFVGQQGSVFEWSGNVVTVVGSNWNVAALSLFTGFQSIVLRDSGRLRVTSNSLGASLTNSWKSSVVAVAGVVSDSMASVHDYANSAALQVYSNTIMSSLANTEKQSTSAAYGLVWVGVLGLSTAARLTLSYNDVSVQHINTATGPVSIWSCAVSINTSAAVLLRSGSRLECEGNTVRLGLQSAGVAFVVSATVGTTISPAALVLQGSAAVTVSTNSVLALSSSWSPDVVTATVGVLVSVAAYYGPALVMMSSSELSVDGNLVSCGVAVGGVKLDFSSLQVGLLPASVKAVAAPDVVAYQFMDGASVVIAAASAFSLRYNSVQGISSGSALSIHTSLTFNSLFLAWYAKALLLTSSASLQASGNAVRQTALSGILLNLYLEPYDAGDRYEYYVLPMLLANAASLVFSDNTVLASSAGIRWFFNVQPDCFSWVEDECCSYDNGSCVHECSYSYSECNRHPSYLALLTGSSAIITSNRLTASLGVGAAWLIDQTTQAASTFLLDVAAKLTVSANLFSVFNTPALVAFRCIAGVSVENCVTRTSTRRGWPASPAVGAAITVSANAGIFLQGNYFEMTAVGRRTTYLPAVDWFSQWCVVNGSVQLVRNTMVARLDETSTAKGLLFLSNGSWAISSSPAYGVGSFKSSHNRFFTNGGVASLISVSLVRGYAGCMLFNCDLNGNLLLSNREAYVLSGAAVIAGNFPPSLVNFDACTSFSRTGNRTRTSSLRVSVGTDAQSRSHTRIRGNTVSVTRTILRPYRTPPRTPSRGTVVVTTSATMRMPTASVSPTMPLSRTDPFVSPSTTRSLHLSSTITVRGTATSSRSASHSVARRSESILLSHSFDRGSPSSTFSASCAPPPPPLLLVESSTSTSLSAETNVLRVIEFQLAALSAAGVDAVLKVSVDSVISPGAILRSAASDDDVPTEVGGPLSPPQPSSTAGADSSLFAYFLCSERVVPSDPPVEANGDGSFSVPAELVDVSSGFVLARGILYWNCTGAEVAWIQWLSSSITGVTALWSNASATVPSTGALWEVQAPIGSLLRLTNWCNPQQPVPLLRAHLKSVLSSAQLAVRNAITAGSVVSFALQLFTGDGGNELQSLILVSLMPCTSGGTSVSGGYSALRALAPLLMHSTYESVILSNLLLVSAICAAQLLGMALVVAVRRQGLAFTDQSNGRLPSASELVRFPSLTVSTLLFTYQGSLFAAVRLLQTADGSAANIALGTVFVVVLVPVPGLVYWLAKSMLHRSYHAYAVPLSRTKQAYTLSYRVFTCLGALEPRGLILPSSVANAWGPIVSFCVPSPLWVASLVFSGWMMACAAALQVYTARGYCCAVFLLLAFSSVGMAVLVLRVCPKRSRSMNVVTALQLGVTAVVLVGVSVASVQPSAAFGDTTMALLGAVQTLLGFITSFSSVTQMWGIRLQKDRHGVLRMEWSVGPLSDDAQRQEKRYARYLEARGQRRALKSLLLEEHGEDEGAVDPQLLLQLLEREEADPTDDAAVADTIMMQERDVSSFGTEAVLGSQEHPHPGVVEPLDRKQDEETWISSVVYKPRAKMRQPNRPSSSVNESDDDDGVAAFAATLSAARTRSGAGGLAQGSVLVSPTATKEDEDRFYARVALQATKTNGGADFSRRQASGLSSLDLLNGSMTSETSVDLLRQLQPSFAVSMPDTLSARPNDRQPKMLPSRAKRRSGTIKR